MAKLQCNPSCLLWPLMNRSHVVDYLIFFYFVLLGLLPVITIWWLMSYFLFWYFLNITRTPFLYPSGVMRVTVYLLNKAYATGSLSYYVIANPDEYQLENNWLYSHNVDTSMFAMKVFCAFIFLRWKSKLCRMTQPNNSTITSCCEKKIRIRWYLKVQQMWKTHCRGNGGTGWLSNTHFIQ